MFHNRFLLKKENPGNLLDTAVGNETSVKVFPSHLSWMQGPKARRCMNLHRSVVPHFTNAGSHTNRSLKTFFSTLHNVRDMYLTELMIKVKLVVRPPWYD